MGIFSVLRALKNSAKSGGNFGFIAQNVACINYIINNSELSEEFSEDQILYATGLIDMYSYISQGIIDSEEIEKAVLFAKAGIMNVNFARNVHGMMDDFENSTLLNFTMQLEALIFTYTTKNDANSVIAMVLEEKQKILNVINKTLNEGKACNLYKDLHPMVNGLLSNSDFRNIVKSYSGN